jgi:hypothetical protein
MKKRIIFANILLLLCMVALTYKLKQDWEQWDKEHSLQTLMQRVKAVEPDVRVPEVKTTHAILAANEITYISDNNLFHKDRNMQLPQDPALEAKPQLTNPPAIMGMMTIEGVRFVQVRPEKGGADDNRSMRLGEGDKWEGDWVVESILDDRIVLLAKDTREEVLFHDPSKRKPRKPAPQTAKVGSPGGGGAVLTIGAKSGGTAVGRTASAAPPPASAIKPPTTPTKSAAAQDRSQGGTRNRNSLFQSRRSNGQQSTFGAQSGQGGASGTQRSNPLQRSNPFRSNQRQQNY